MSEEITDGEAYMLGLQVLGSPGGLDEIEQKSVEVLAKVVADLSRDLARGKIPPEMREMVEYIVSEGTARLKELGVSTPGPTAN